MFKISTDLNIKNESASLIYYVLVVFKESKLQLNLLVISN